MNKNNQYLKVTKFIIIFQFCINLMCWIFACDIIIIIGAFYEKENNVSSLS